MTRKKDTALRKRFQFTGHPLLGFIVLLIAAVFLSAPACRSEIALKKGAEGELVTKIQIILEAEGFLKTVDGKFGLLTEKAVRQFQGKHNIHITQEEMKGET